MPTPPPAVIAAQLEAGIDIGNDGEQARESFVTYVQHRMTGFGGTRTATAHAGPARPPRLLGPGRAPPSAPPGQPHGRPRRGGGRSTYRDTSEVDAECALVAGAGFAETFMTAASPGIVASAMENRHYPSMEDYVLAVAGALRSEYQAIVGRGLLLQIDAPDLALERHTLFATRPLADFVAWVELVVGAINGALRRDRPGPGAAARVLGQLRGPAHPRRRPRGDPSAALPGPGGRVGGVDGQPPPRPRVPVLRDGFPLPDDMVLVAGVIDTTSNYVEHPEVVADRIVRVAEAVGDPRRVIAGTDCGFDTSAGIGDIAPSVVWEKLRALQRRRGPGHDAAGMS